MKKRAGIRAAAAVCILVCFFSVGKGRTGI